MYALRKTHMEIFPIFEDFAFKHISFFYCFFPPPATFVKYWLMKQTDLPEKNRGFLGIFSIPLLRTCYRRNRTDVPEEAQRTTERKLEEKANTGKEKIGVLWLPLELRHCLCVRVCRGQGMGVAERKRKGLSSGMRRRRDERTYPLSWKPTHLLLGCILGINRFN